MSGTLHWFKSTYSGDEGQCLEVAYIWRKSSHSGDEGTCVEVAACPHTIRVRDSKNPEDGPVLTASPEAWSAFAAHAAR